MVAETGDPMNPSDQRRAYWLKTVLASLCLLLLCFGVTFGIAYNARALNDQYTFLGFPLAYYMGAQGSLVLYVLIVWFYARLMKYLDKRYHVDEQDEE